MTHNQLEDNNVIDYLVIGAGPAGIAAARTLHDAGKEVAIFEQNSVYGGLCGSFDFQSCTFDKFVHLSFAPENVRNTWFNSTPLIPHKPEASNFYNDKWLKHPAITNLAPLSIAQKAKILYSFMNRPAETGATDYYEWTKQIFGEYFATEFMEKYTKKYWGVGGKMLDTSWVGERFHKPTVEEILHGMLKRNEKSTFYTDMMYYPSHNPDGRSGYVQILDKPAKGLKIFYNHKCKVIDPTLQTCTFNNGYTVKYNHLISSMPMPEMVMSLTTFLSPYKQTLAYKFKHTCGYTVSMIFADPQITDKLWFYVYDPDIISARFYSPSLCCPDNVTIPGKISTLQGEIYFPGRGVGGVTMRPDRQRFYINNTLNNLNRVGIDRNKLLAVDIRGEDYANIIFDDETHEAKNEVLKMLRDYNIVPCGRFGQWEYLWSHQAFASGHRAAQASMSYTKSRV